MQEDKTQAYKYTNEQRTNKKTKHKHKNTPCRKDKQRTNKTPFPLPTVPHPPDPASKAPKDFSLPSASSGGGASGLRLGSC